MSENPTTWRLDLSVLVEPFKHVRPPRKPTTIAAVIVAAAVGAGAWHFMHGTYATDASEWRTVSLEDSSVVRLGPRTRIKARFDRQRRYIVQFSGEATYDVARDPYRPFFVVCGQATVQAIGTKFAVDCDGQNAKVTVAEGTVSVSRGLTQSGQVPSVDHVRADAGEQVLVNLWTPLAPRNVDIKVELAWERGRIVFGGEPIEQAIAAFNRRHKQQITTPRVYDPNYRVFGEFDLEDPEPFIEFLKSSPAVQPR